MKRFPWFLTGTLLALALVIMYACLSHSQKRTIWHTMRQVPSLPARYFV